jgi:hypothetical protein
MFRVKKTCINIVSVKIQTLFRWMKMVYSIFWHSDSKETDIAHKVGGATNSLKVDILMLFKIKFALSKIKIHTKFAQCSELKNK